MERDVQPSVRQRRASQNWVFRAALAVSLILHVILFFAWRVVPLPRSPLSAAGPRSGDFRAAGGGMQSVNLRVAAPRAITPPRVPVITFDDVDPVVFDVRPEIDLSVVGGEAPGIGDGLPGIEGGTGRGDGGTGQEGYFDLIPPSPRGLIVPPDHDALKGKTVDVWVFVDATGRVVADSTRLDPPTSDRGLNRRLISEAAEWVFNPAKRQNEAVAAWFPYSISG